MPNKCWHSTTSYISSSDDLPWASPQDIISLGNRQILSLEIDMQKSLRIEVQTSRIKNMRGRPTYTENAPTNWRPCRGYKLAGHSMTKSWTNQLSMCFETLALESVKQQTLYSIGFWRPTIAKYKFDGIQPSTQYVPKSPVHRYSSTGIEGIALKTLLISSPNFFGNHLAKKGVNFLALRVSDMPISHYIRTPPSRDQLFNSVYLHQEWPICTMYCVGARGAPALYLNRSKLSNVSCRWWASALRDTS